MKLRDLMSDPLARMMKYPDLLERVRKYTQEEDEVLFLDLIVSISTFNILITTILNESLSTFITTEPTRFL